MTENRQSNALLPVLNNKPRDMPERDDFLGEDRLYVGSVWDDGLVSLSFVAIWIPSSQKS